MSEQEETGSLSTSKSNESTSTSPLSPSASSSSTSSSSSSSSSSGSAISSGSGGSSDSEIDFTKLQPLKQSPVHLAVFMNYLLTYSIPESIFFHLSVEQFKLLKTLKEKQEAATAIYKFYLQPQAILEVDFTGADVTGQAPAIITSIENALTPIGKLNLKEIGSIFDALEEFAVVSIYSYLSLFRQSLDLGLGDSYGAYRIGEIEKGNAAHNTKIVVDLLRKHLTALQDNDDDESKQPETSQESERNIQICNFLINYMVKIGCEKSAFDVFKPQPKSKKEKETIMSRMSTKSKKVHTTEGHQFVATHYNKPTFCDSCSDMLWGIGNQGYQCKVCGYNCHKRPCQGTMEKCTGIQRSNSIAPAQQKKKTVLFDTFRGSKSVTRASVIGRDKELNSTSSQIAVPTSAPASAPASALAPTPSSVSVSVSAPTSSSTTPVPTITTNNCGSLDADNSSHDNISIHSAESVDDVSNEASTSSSPTHASSDTESLNSNPGIVIHESEQSDNKNLNTSPVIRRKFSLGGGGDPRTPPTPSPSSPNSATTSPNNTVGKSSQSILRKISIMGGRKSAKSNPPVPDADVLQSSTEKLQAELDAQATSAAAAAADLSPEGIVPSSSSSPSSPTPSPTAVNVISPATSTSNIATAHLSVSTTSMNSDSLETASLDSSASTLGSSFNVGSVESFDTNSLASSNSFSSNNNIAAAVSSAQATCWSDTVTNWEELAHLSKKEIKRQEVIYELIKTERNFVANLEIMQEVFMQPLLKSAKAGRGEQIASLFANLEDILKLNKELCLKLESRQRENIVVEQIGDIFLEMFDGLHIYADFCANQNQAMENINNWKKRSNTFAQALKECESNPRANRMVLTEYLPMPMQRLTRYPLLLETIIGCTPKQHKDHTPTLHAVLKVKEVATLVNDKVKKNLNAQRLQKLQKSLDTTAFNYQLDLISVPREILLEGELTLTAARSNRKKNIVCHAVLLNDYILLTQKKDAGYVLVIDPIPVYKLLVRNDESKTCTFFLLNMDGDVKFFELISTSVFEKKTWMEATSNAVRSQTAPAASITKVEVTPPSVVSAAISAVGNAFSKEEKPTPPKEGLVAQQSVWEDGPTPTSTTPTPTPTSTLTPTPTPTSVPTPTPTTPTFPTLSSSTAAATATTAPVKGLPSSRQDSISSTVSSTTTALSPPSQVVEDAVTTAGGNNTTVIEILYSKLQAKDEQIMSAVGEKRALLEEFRNWRYSTYGPAHTTDDDNDTSRSARASLTSSDDIAAFNNEQQDHHQAVTAAAAAAANDNGNGNGNGNASTTSSVSDSNSSTNSTSHEGGSLLSVASSETSLEDKEFEATRKDSGRKFALNRRKRSIVSSGSINSAKFRRAKSHVEDSFGAEPALDFASYTSSVLHAPMAQQSSDLIFLQEKLVEAADTIASQQTAIEQLRAQLCEANDKLQKLQASSSNTATTTTTVTAPAISTTNSKDTHDNTSNTSNNNNNNNNNNNANNDNKTAVDSSTSLSVSPAISVSESPSITVDVPSPIVVVTVAPPSPAASSKGEPDFPVEDNKPDSSQPQFEEQKSDHEPNQELEHSKPDNEPEREPEPEPEQEQEPEPEPTPSVSAPSTSTPSTSTPSTSTKKNKKKKKKAIQKSFSFEESANQNEDNAESLA